jgi:hypothetical protein
MSGPPIPTRTSSVKGPAPFIPERSNSKPKAELIHRRNACNDDLKQIKKRARLSGKASHDSAFWSYQAGIAYLEKQSVEAHVDVRKFEVEFEDSLGKNGRTWAEELADHMASISAFELHRKVAEKQAAITNPDEAKNPGRRVRESFVKLFTTSTMGFNLRYKEGEDSSSSARDTSDQSDFKQAVLRAYHPDDWQKFPGEVWDPVLGCTIDKQASNAAHLYNWRAETSMDTIFGAGSSSELFSWKNGLILHKVVENALDIGVIAIVPLLRPNTRWEKIKQLRQDMEVKELILKDRQKLTEECIKLRDEINQEDNEKLLEDKNLVRSWEKTEPKEYMAIVLDWNNRQLKATYFPHSFISKLEQLHNWPVQFLTSARPRARYVWWTFLRGITCLNWRSPKGIDMPIAKEVRKGVRFWGTRGRYVKENQLRGFVEELGQDIDSILENGLEDDSDKSGPDPEALGVIAAEHLRRANPIEEDSDDEDLY